MTFAEKFNNTRKKFKKPFFGFELFNNQTKEYEYGELKYSEQTNKLSWLDFSIEADNDFSVDENIEALYQEIVESGKYE